MALSPPVRAIAGLMLPGVFGTAIYQINQYVAQVLAYYIGDSSASVINYASRLMELPIGVFAIAIATVVYPLIAQHAVEARFDAMAGDYRKGLRYILIINVPAAVGLALLSEPIVRLLFQHGHFRPSDTLQTAPLVALFAIGMPFFSVVSLTTRAFYAVKETKTPVKIAAVNFGVNLVLSLVLMRSLEVAGLALASTLAVVAQTFLLQRALARRLPAMTFGPLWGSLAKIVVATAAMTVVVGAGWFGLRHAVTGRAADLVAVLGLIPLACVTYAGLLWFLKIEGREELSALVGSGFWGKSGGGGP